MKKAQATLEIRVPIEATESQIREWIEFNTHYRADMSLDNPLSAFGMDAAECCVDVYPI